MDPAARPQPQSRPRGRLPRPTGRRRSTRPPPRARGERPSGCSKPAARPGRRSGLLRQISPRVVKRARLEALLFVPLFVGVVVLYETA